MSLILKITLIRTEDPQAKKERKIAKEEIKLRK